MRKQNEYLLSTQQRSFTHSNKDKLDAELKLKQAEYEKLILIPIEDLWEKDLSALEEELEKQNESDKADTRKRKKKQEDAQARRLRKKDLSDLEEELKKQNKSDKADKRKRKQQEDAQAKRLSNCPNELEEAASNLLYAAPRCGEFPELQEIRAILTSRFGKEFAYGAIELRSNYRVSQKMIQKLSPRKSSLESRMKMLLGIATENGIVLQLEESSPEIRKEEWVVDKKRNQLNTEVKVEEVAEMGLPEKIEKALSLSESMKGRKEYRDVADAAQDAFESAAYAVAAARAAVKLSRLESFNSARKVLNRTGCQKGSSTPRYDSESENEKIDEGERSRYNMKVAEFVGSDSDD